MALVGLIAVSPPAVGRGPIWQVIFRYYDGRTGEFDYAEAVSVDRE